MVKREWGVRWVDTGHEQRCDSEAIARSIVEFWPGKCVVLSRWVRESPWKAD